MLEKTGAFLRGLVGHGASYTGANAFSEAPAIEAKATPSGKTGSVQLPPQATPKATSKAAAFASYLTTARQASFPLPQTDRRLASTDITTYRTGATTAQTMRDFAAASPDLAAAIFAYLRTAITGGYTAVAKNPDNTFNPEATNLLQQIIMRMHVLPTYADGFGGAYSLRSVAESLGKEGLLYGAMSSELVLDKTKLPWRIQPIHVGQIKFVPDGNDLKPQQWLAGAKIDLDIPTFFYVSLDQDLLTAYASSPLEPALKPTLFAEDFMQDLWRVVKRAVHPRQHVKIDWAKVQAQVPPEAIHDQEKLTAWMNQVVADITAKVNTIGVNEALVYFDFMTIERETNGNTSLSSEWQTLQDMVNSKLATGAKTLPAILGHGVGSSNVASTESMLFVKSAAGAVQAKLNEMFSRIFTLSVRLFGYDVVVEFKYDPIDLRPDTELESFKALKQSRVLEQLSLGLITDEEACLTLTGKLPPSGMAPLMGTMFAAKKADPNANGNAPPSNDGSTLNQNLKSSAPAGGARGSNTKGGAKASVIDLHQAREG